MKHIENLEIIQDAVYNTLGVGRENAISGAELGGIIEYRDRHIREAIEALRYDKAILNLGSRDGYYIPDSTPQGRQEAAVWLAKQDKRVRSMKYSTRDAGRFMAYDKKRDMPGQINIFGVGDIWQGGLEEKKVNEGSENLPGC